MVYERISATIEKEDLIRKARAGVSWRYIIAKGLTHIDTCVPREEDITHNYNLLLKGKSYMKMAYYIREKHPAIWDEMLQAGVREVN